ncbi:hypothetical protein DL98DRAFT_541634 [Cadophora sp. DSE1049]|nr:hypothetical protein DL98DRAFT_541634 [Cadophora sp. DSE1049]
MFQTLIDRAGDRWVLIAKKTTIPIPKIHAYALSDDTRPLSSFLILQYIEGRKLTHTDLRGLSDEQCTRLHTSLAGIYAQLRRLEFPSIGYLTRRSDGFKVCKRTVSIDLNMQELEGLAPRCIQSRYYGSGSTLTSATEYVAILLKIADNTFTGDRSPISQEEGEDQLYHLHIFRQYAIPQYKNFLTHFDKFLAVLRVIKQEQYGNEILTKEWEIGKQKSGFMVANALENWTAID